jgi:hypothetical protein
MAQLLVTCPKTNQRASTGIDTEGLLAEEC